MGIYASHRFKITALICALLLCISCTAYAQYYRLGDEDEEIATIQSALKQLKFYTGDITGHFGTRTKEAVQSKNGRRRFKKNWIKGDKRLEEVIGTIRFNSAESYLGLLPPPPPPLFYMLFSV